MWKRLACNTSRNSWSIQIIPQVLLCMPLAHTPYESEPHGMGGVDHFVCTITDIHAHIPRKDGKAGFHGILSTLCSELRRLCFFFVGEAKCKKSRGVVAR